MTEPLDLSNIQGDILVGLPKQTEAFFFFSILESRSFRSQLTNIIPLITTAEKAQQDRFKIRQFKAQAFGQTRKGDRGTIHPSTLEVGGVNIAFSAQGIEKIGVTDVNHINDPLFVAGQRADALNLGDNGTTDKNGFHPAWDTTFLRGIDGVVLITGDCQHTIDHQLDQVKKIMGPTIEEINTLVGNVRPKENRGHEHFGYKDGVSQPLIKDVDPEPTEGQGSIAQGVLLLKRDGDVDLTTTQPMKRPDWALDGSFLAFRKLPQLVPEFDAFLQKEAPVVLDPSADVVGLLGARLVGRWKSGAPISEAPLVDNPELGDLNVFNFVKGNQAACPFAAHIRKMNPRGDIDEERGIKPHRLPRRGIPFGIEVTEEERKTGITEHERGLYFVCYQSNLANGFSFLQRAWANVSNFPPVFPENEEPGADAIIGQKSDVTNPDRTITGADGNDTDEKLKLDKQWVNSKGGEYFFSPSISTLRDVFATTSTEMVEL